MRKLNIIKPLFENYTAFDEPVVRLASNYKLYLIGGTAIDMLCRYYNIDNNYILGVIYYEKNFNFYVFII